MKPTLLIMLLAASISAQAETHWWQEGGRYEERSTAKIQNKNQGNTPAVEKQQDKVKDQQAAHRRDHNQHRSDEHRPRRIVIHKTDHKRDRKHDHHDRHRSHHRDHHDYGHRYTDRGYKRDRHYHDNHRDYDRHDYRPRRWQHVQAFRGRSGKDVTRDIRVQERVEALSIEGTKRAMYIREAYALLGNGRWIRVRGLEGYVGNGERIRHRLRNPRFVQKVVLEIEPARYKRGYAELLIRPA